MILDPLTGGILATGWSENCAQILFEISRDPWDGRELAYSFFSELNHFLNTISVNRKMT
jgi:hypothetical protein